MDVTSEQLLSEQVAASDWYHSMRLPGGIVTPGIRSTVDELPRVPLPASLAGNRCLDVGTADGFWAFEMERRGASEVLAIDVRDPSLLDWPGVPRSEARMREIGGAELLKHRGFEIAHRALDSSVQLPEMPVYQLEAPGWPLWWVLNLAAYRHLFPAAGLDIIQAGRPFVLKPGPSFGPTPRSGRAPDGIQRWISARIGLLHAWVRARPGAPEL